jgi:hypothetical protein
MAQVLVVSVRGCPACAESYKHVTPSLLHKVVISVLRQVSLRWRDNSAVSSTIHKRHRDEVGRVVIRNRRGGLRQGVTESIRNRCVRRELDLSGQNLMITAVDVLQHRAGQHPR